MRRLTNDEHLSAEFATTWPEYDLDAKTRACRLAENMGLECAETADRAAVLANMAYAWDPAWLREVVGAEVPEDQAREIRAQLRAAMLIAALCAEWLVRRKVGLR